MTGGLFLKYDLMAKLVVVEYVFDVSQYTPKPHGTCEWGREGRKATVSNGDGVVGGGLGSWEVGSGKWAQPIMILNFTAVPNTSWHGIPTCSAKYPIMNGMYLRRACERFTAGSSSGLGSGVEASIEICGAVDALVGALVGALAGALATRSNEGEGEIEMPSRWFGLVRAAWSAES